MGDVVKVGAVKCSIAGSPCEAAVWIDAQRGVTLAIGEGAIQFTHNQARELAGLLPTGLIDERCCHPDCTATVRRTADGSRCGGVLFGVRDGSVGCGRFFCDAHLVGKLGPFFCRPCWEARRASERVESARQR